MILDDFVLTPAVDDEPPADNPLVAFFWCRGETMLSQHQQILNGPALAMIEYIRNHNIGIDIQRLEALDKHIRIHQQPVSPEFLIESRRVRQELKVWFERQDA